MACLQHDLLRVLVAESDQDTRDLYCRVFSSQEHCRIPADRPEAREADLSLKRPPKLPTSFELIACRRADEALLAVGHACRENRPFAVAFLDACIAATPDGTGTIPSMLSLDPDIQIVYVLPAHHYAPFGIDGITSLAPEALYLQKPFTSHDVYNLAYALGSKWQAERERERLLEKLEGHVEKRTADLSRAVFQLEQQVTRCEQVKTAQQESEAMYRLLVNSLPNTIFKGYTDGAVDFFDDKIELLTGYKREDFDSRKMKWTDLVVEEDVQSVKGAFIKALKTCRSYMREYRIRGKNGDVIWIQEGSRIVCDEQGRIQFVSGAFLDITEKKRSEEQIRRMNEELEHRVAERTAELSHSLRLLKETQGQLVQSEKMAALGGLVAGIAHEINTPVGIGVTATSLLEERTRECKGLFASGRLKRSELEAYLDLAVRSSEMIMSNLHRAAGLIQSFKQVAVDQSHEERRRFRLKEYIEQVLLSLRPTLKKTQHRVSVNCPEDLVLDSYPGAFSQIVTNLVMNSLIHGFEDMEKGEMVFDLSEEKATVLFKYSDNGRGMSEELVTRIFEPFFTTRRARGGTGLGLHIVYNLVTQTLGGQISCTSALGQGVVFLIRIPKAME